MSTVLALIANKVVNLQQQQQQKNRADSFSTIY
jgi:hypothetical protein